MFKCKGYNFLCLHLGNTCDQRKDCPLGDDEFLCELKNVPCPLNCQCLALAMLCTNATLTIPQNKIPFISIVIGYSQRLIIENLLLIAQDSLYMTLLNNKITDFCVHHNTGKLVLLDVSSNLLTSLKKLCFNKFIWIKVISVSDNLIKHTESQAFAMLLQLSYLNLSNNNIVTLSKAMFSFSPQLKLLSIKNNPLTIIHEEVFKDMELKAIETTNYQICCIAPVKAKCNAHQPW